MCEHLMPEQWPYESIRPCIWWTSPEGRNLLFALLEVHTAVDLRNLPCEAHTFQAAHREV